MKSRYYLILVLLAATLTLLGCAVEAEPIEFGKAQCHFCGMTVVDRQHASQAVTQKGKQFQYDSVECLVKELVKNGSETDFAILLVSDYGRATMVSAPEATYLISEKIKSPMGENLSAFESRETAEAAKKKYGGETYSWDRLKERFSNN